MRRAAIRVLHAALVILAALPWALAMLLLGVCLGLVLLADRLWPEANLGNCWSYVGPRWARHGGYILIRRAQDLSLIPHAIWCVRLPETAAVAQTEPVKRATRWWQAWRLPYFRFRVRTSERPRNSDWADL